MPTFIDTINEVLDKIENAKNRLAELATQVADGVQSAVDHIIEDTDGPLEGENRALAESIFGDSLDYDAIIINDTSFMADVNQHWNDGSRPFVLGNTINSNEPLSQEELIHELMHVWQYQTGGLGYITDSISDNTYSYDGNSLATFAGLPEGERLNQFNVEQQAEIVSHYFVLTNETRPLTADLELHNMEDSNGDPIIINEGNIDQYIADMQPYIDELQNTEPNDGVSREANEMVVEVIEEGGEAIEEITGEGAEMVDEIQREWNEGDVPGAIREGVEGTAEVIYEGGEGAVETVYEIGEGVVEIGTERVKDIFGL